MVIVNLTPPMEDAKFSILLFILVATVVVSEAPDIPTVNVSVPEFQVELASFILPSKVTLKKSFVSIAFLILITSTWLGDSSIPTRLLRFVISMFCVANPPAWALELGLS